MLRLVINHGFSFDSSIACSELFRVVWGKLGHVSGDRRQNLKTKFAHTHEESEFIYSAYLVATGHLQVAYANQQVYWC